MLLSIHVKNFALIDDLTIDLSKGLNVISGETGAGKSIVIDAVNFALGKRMPKDVVRDDAEYASSELVFSIENENIREVLKDMGIDGEDDIIVLNRKIVNGRNTCKVNGETVTTAVLKKLSELLIDIHGQHEHQSLINKNSHIAFLDSCLEKDDKLLLENAGTLYGEYVRKNNELTEALSSDSKKDKDIALASFEVKEINDAKLVIGEDDELEVSYRKMCNAKKIAEAVYFTHALTGYENEGAGSLVGRGIASLKNVSAYDNEAECLLNMLTDIDGILNDFNKSIAAYEDGLVFSDAEFIECENRLNLVNSLKSRYGNTIEAILKYCEQREADLKKYEDFDEYLLSLKAEVESKKKELLELCKLLSDKRQKKSQEVSKTIEETLKYLNFLDSKFEISVIQNEESINEKGIDTVEMLISTNPGERLKPLAQVASGGEVSRIMLAIKSALADKDNIPTLIFDEIDTGISGRTAQKVSEKISVISKNHQVLLVTHLPQIAAMADTHFEISKSVNDGRTVTTVKELKEEEQINELARMLSGAEITDAVISSAKEMKTLANELKGHI